MDFDELLPEIGEFGTYQKLVLWFLLVPGVFPCGFHAYNQLFMTSLPEHWCQVPILRQNHPNASEELLKKISIPYDKTTKSFSKCSRYDLDYEHGLPHDLSGGTIEANETLSHILALQSKADVVPCDNGWHYQLEQYTTTIVADWDLVCDKAFFPTLGLVLLGASGLVGNYLFGLLQDGMGRRPAFFIYLCIFCAFGLGTAFVTSFGWWLGCRIGVGFTIPAIMSTPMVLALELVGPAQRTYTTVIMNIAYSFTLITLAAVAYFVRIWSQLTLATTIPFLAFYGFWWVLPESPRWLLARGRVDEAYKIISTMARVNKKPLRSDLLSSLKKRRAKEETENAGKQEGKKKYGVLHLFRTPNLCKKTLIITFIWFTNTSVYVGLSYYAPVLGGDPYLNFFLAGLSELPTYLFLWASMEYWGRRWTLCFSMVVGGSACIATILSQNDQVVTLVLYCMGKFGISSSFVVLPLMASELYPTVVRGMGLALSSTAGMIGPVVIPLINYLGSEMLVLPLIIMGVLLILGGVSSLVLPETLYQSLPQSLEEGENFGKNMTKKDYCNCCPRRSLKKDQVDPESPTNENEIAIETDELRPLPDEELFEESPYSSLRRNSFLKAQNEAIPFDEQTMSSSIMEGNNAKRAGKRSSIKAPKSSFEAGTTSSLDRNLLRNGQDSPLLQRPAKVTII